MKNVRYRCTSRYRVSEHEYDEHLSNQAQLWPPSPSSVGARLGFVTRTEKWMSYQSVKVLVSLPWMVALWRHGARGIA